MVVGMTNFQRKMSSNRHPKVSTVSVQTPPDRTPELVLSMLTVALCSLALENEVFQGESRMCDDEWLAALSAPENLDLCSAGIAARVRTFGKTTRSADLGYTSPNLLNCQARLTYKAVSPLCSTINVLIRPVRMSPRQYTEVRNTPQRENVSAPKSFVGCKPSLLQPVSCPTTTEQLHSSAHTLVRKSLKNNT